MSDYFRLADHLGAIRSCSRFAVSTRSALYVQMTFLKPLGDKARSNSSTPVLDRTPHIRQNDDDYTDKLQLLEGTTGCQFLTTVMGVSGASFTVRLIKKRRPSWPTA